MAQDFDPQDIPESLVQDASIGGYECDLFLESVGTEFKCCKCKLILREPHRLICCDERVCKSCIPNEEEPCSQCQQCNSTASYDEVTSERVMRLNVQCKHYREECEWSGELVALDGHLAHECQYRKLKCPYGCPENISFCDLEIHKSDECNLRPAEKKADTNSRKIKELTQENRLLKQKLKEQCKNQQACENWIKISWFLLIVLPVITGWCMNSQQADYDAKLQQLRDNYDSKLQQLRANIEKIPNCCNFDSIWQSIKDKFYETLDDYLPWMFKPVKRISSLSTM